MPVMKEWHCEQCKIDFERLTPVCPSCHGERVKRTFLTPVGIARGSTDAHSAKRTDAILAHQFAKLGITNFKTAEFGKPNKVEWAPKHFGPAPCQGGQAAIIPSFGRGSLAQLGLDPANLQQTKDTSGGVGTLPYSVPNDVGAGLQPGAVVGGNPAELFQRTNTIGGIDVVGKQVVRVK